MALSKCPGCGHALPEQSHFCPACGRALGDKERPRAAGDRSQSWNEFLDKAWDFFASTKVATVLIALLAIASIGGSLIEQESLYQDWREPAIYYPIRYGEFWGNFYMKTGLTHAYSSIWYAGLVLICVVNLIICSFQRLIPLHRTLTRPQVWKLPHFISRQEVVAEIDGDLELAKTKLKKLGYNLRQDRECLYGDKGRLSRYGPYIIHIGLLVVAFAAFAKALPGWDVTEDLWLRNGGTGQAPGTSFAVLNKKFTLDLYENGAPARFATDAVLLDGEGKEITSKVIEVNHPLRYDGWEIYQASWREEPGIATIQVLSDATKQSVAEIKFDLKHPEPTYPVTDDVSLHVANYYHDFMADPASGEYVNASYEIRNPVIMAEFVKNGTGEVLGRSALAVLDQSLTPPYNGPFFLKSADVETRWYTALKLHKDKTVPYMYTGLGIVILGMAITFFVFHWQVWVREENGKLLLGARAYKNKYGLKQEFRRHFGLGQGEDDD